MAVRGRKPLLPSPLAHGPEAVPPRIREEGHCASGDHIAVFDAAIDGDRVAEAKSICADCPVRVLCFTYALGNEQHGVWGGTTADERDEFRRDVILFSPEQRRATDALWAEISSGRSREHIARDYGVSLRTLERWIREYAQTSRAA